MDDLFKKYCEAPTKISFSDKPLKTERLSATVSHTSNTPKKEESMFMEIRDGKFVGWRKF